MAPARSTPPESAAPSPTFAWPAGERASPGSAARPGPVRTTMIGFIGLSHLGLNYSLATAAKGFEVVAFDPDAALVADLQQGRFPIDEPGFNSLYAENRARLRYTADPAA